MMYILLGVIVIAYTFVLWHLLNRVEKLEDQVDLLTGPRS